MSNFQTNHQAHRMLIDAGLVTTCEEAQSHESAVEGWSKTHKLLWLPGKSRKLTADHAVIAGSIHHVLGGWTSQGKPITDLDVLRIAVRAGVPLREEAMEQAERAAVESIRSVVSFVDTLLRDSSRGLIERLSHQNPHLPALSRGRFYQEVPDPEYSDDIAALGSQMETVLGTLGSEIDPAAVETALALLNAQFSLGVTDDEVSATTDKLIYEDPKASPDSQPPGRRMNELLFGTPGLVPQLFYDVEKLVERGGVSGLLSAAKLVLDWQESGSDLNPRWFEIHFQGAGLDLSPELSALLGAAFDATGSDEL